MVLNRAGPPVVAAESTASSALVSFFPIILMGVLFGLAMDYEVFLVSQMREDYVHTGNAKHAIRTGFIGSARVVTAAAIIMISVFAAFIPDGSATIKPIAIGLAVGVFVDAFLVRMTLVPAVLALLGKNAWWIPRTLDRALPSIDVEGQSLVKHVEQTEWDEANPGVAVRAEQLLLESSEGPVEVDLRVPIGTVWTVEHDDPRWRSALVWTISGWRKPDGGSSASSGAYCPRRAGSCGRRYAWCRRPVATRTSSRSGSTSAASSWRSRGARGRPATRWTGLSTRRRPGWLHGRGRARSQVRLEDRQLGTSERDRATARGPSAAASQQPEMSSSRTPTPGSGPWRCRGSPVSATRSSTPPTRPSCWSASASTSTPSQPGNRSPRSRHRVRSTPRMAPHGRRRTASPPEAVASKGNGHE